MLFEADQPIPLLICTTCRASGVVAWRTCSECKGLSAARLSRGKLLYWSYPLERYHLALEHSRQLFNRVRKITVAVIALTLWLWAAYYIWRWIKLLPTESMETIPLASLIPPGGRILLLLGLICFSYLFYRSLKEERQVAEVEKYDYKQQGVLPPNQSLSAWVQAAQVSQKQRVNIAQAFTLEALQILGIAYNVADQNAFNKVNPFHLFFALLVVPKIRTLFVRLGLDVPALQKRLVPLFADRNSTTGGTHTAPVISPELLQVIFKAYEAAYQAHQEMVDVTELMLCTVRSSPEIQDMLFDYKVDKDTLLNVVEWARIKDRLRRQYHQFQKAARHRSKHGMDRAMTAVATPFLNSFSEDVTLLAQMGYTNPCIAREREIREIFQVVDGGQNSVLLVGDYGVGKKSILEGIAEKMVEEDVPARLRDRRFVRLSISSLLAGTTPSGAAQRLISIMHEISRAGNIIVCIHNLHELMGVTAGGQDSLDVAGTLSEFLAGGSFLTIATTTPEAFAQYISNSKLSSVFTKVTVSEMDENQTIQVLESKVGYFEYKHQVYYVYDALAKAAHLAKRFIRDTTLPGSALEIMSEAGIMTRNKKGKDALVTAEEVGGVVAQKTHIPTTSVTADETTKLLRLEEKMHERVIGQEEAVSLVANALRRARAEIRSQNRPISNFLFLGPTGVGKTELAKTIAEVYFGGEERMLRFDMSEYQDKNSLSRLIGSPGQKGSGLLTEAVRTNPFALVLLDEIEKADKDILNVFLQVMDDGRLTDSTGHVVDFTNVILIATSNAGTNYVQEQIQKGLSSDAIKDRLLHGELKQYFRPEFINRFDGIVLFKPLEREGIKQIAGLMLKRVAKDLEAKGITLEVTDAALDFFAQVGFDPEFGARPLRRSIQERVENKLAELVLSQKLGRRDTIVLGQGGELQVTTH